MTTQETDTGARMRGLLERIQRLRTGPGLDREASDEVDGPLSDSAKQLLQQRAMQLAELDLEARPTPTTEDATELLNCSLGTAGRWRFAVELGQVARAQGAIKGSDRFLFNQLRLGTPWRL